MMGYVLKMWFRLSVLVLCFSLGWLLERFTYNMDSTIILGMLLFGVVLFAFFKITKRVNSLHLATYCFVCAALFVGGIVARADDFVVNVWIDNSIGELKAMVTPVRDYSDEPVAVALSPQEKERVRQAFSDLQIYNHDIASPILIDFTLHGLVLLDRNNIIPLNKERTLLSFVRSDNTIVYTQKGDSRQILTKATIQNGSMQRLWVRDTTRKYLHHYGDEFQNRIYHQGRRFMDLPNELSQQIGHEFAKCNVNYAMNSTIEIFDYQTGEHLNTIELLPIIAAHEGTDALRQSIYECDDPLHLNSIQIIKSKKHARYFPNGKAGDMIVSLREINTIMLLDKDTSEIKWYVVGGNTGKFKMQHSPRLTDRGTLLVFDNLGSDEPNGQSRIVEVDIASGELHGFYEATGDEYFESRRGGKIQIVDNRIVVYSHGSNKHQITSMFVLDCSETYVSHACTRMDIFSGPPEYGYNYGAVLLNN